MSETKAGKIITDRHENPPLLIPESLEGQEKLVMESVEFVHKLRVALGTEELPDAGELGQAIVAVLDYTDVFRDFDDYVEKHGSRAPFGRLRRLVAAKGR